MKTTSYKISKQLAEAGFKANSDNFYLVDGRLVRNGQEIKCNPVICDGEPIETYLAYDLETLLEALPESNAPSYNLVLEKSDADSVGYFNPDEGYNIKYYRSTKPHYAIEESLADTAARLWLKLKENGLV